MSDSQTNTGRAFDLNATMPQLGFDDRRRSDAQKHESRPVVVLIRMANFQRRPSVEIQACTLRGPPPATRYKSLCSDVREDVN